MARSVREEDYQSRRNEILDSTQRLVYAKGFDQMTVKDILDDLQISKGALYYYFESKWAILEALVERMVDQIEPSLISIVQDERLSGLEKLQNYLNTGVQWKTTRKSLMLSLLRVWYADENAIVRQKVFTSTVERVTPWIMKIIEQGVQEGTFTIRQPEYFCQVIIYLLQGLSDTFAAFLLMEKKDQQITMKAEEAAAAYSQSLERVLGTERGSIILMDRETLYDWFSGTENMEIPSEDISTEVTIDQSPER